MAMPEQQNHDLTAPVDAQPPAPLPEVNSNTPASEKEEVRKSLVEIEDAYENGAFSLEDALAIEEHRKRVGVPAARFSKSPLRSQS